MTLHDPSFVRDQYRDSSNFDARVLLHTRYSTNAQPWPRWVFERLDLGASARVLEVGCGPGYLWRDNEIPRGWRVVVSDMSLGMASIAKEHTPTDVIVSDAQSLPWTDASFDAVVANHMLYHVPDLDAALAGFARVLRPGGLLLAATNGQAHFKEVRDVLGTHGRYIDIFGLENGPEKVARHFADVTVERYPDRFEVPEPDPVIAYVNSMFPIAPEKETELRRVIEASIARDGFFRITKDSGLITARRP